MRHVQFIAAETTSCEPLSSRRRTGRSIVAVLVEAFYRSRQVQAERTLERYRHRISQAEPSILRELNARSENRECIRNNRLFWRKPRVQFPASTEKALVATVLIALSIAGVLSTAIQQHAYLIQIIQREKIDLVGYLASGFVLATFSMRSMRWLRLLALASNLAFIAYGCLANLMPVLILHVVLLPVNAYRLMQLCRFEHGPQHARDKHVE